MNRLTVRRLGQCQLKQESISRKGAGGQRKSAKVLNAACSLRLLLCAFAPLRETFFLNIKSHKLKLLLIITLLLIPCLASSVRAQDLDEAAIGGRVSDENGAFIQGATVTLVLTGKGIERAASWYRIPRAPSGRAKRSLLTTPER